MSRIAKNVKASMSAEASGKVWNYMGGVSYAVNPLDTLKMISASSIFGEPQYYRTGAFQDAYVKTNPLFSAFSILPASFDGITTSKAMEQAIDAALDYDFAGVIAWARALRKDYHMRLNPQVIMVRAAKHPARAAFNEANPGVFSDAMMAVMSRADEPAEQLAYYLYTYGEGKGKDGKKEIPAILKRGWARRIEAMSDYEAHKYKDGGVGLINTVRICHANCPVVDELMRTGNVRVETSRETWEVLRSAGKSWREILETTKLGHMALLRNLRGIFSEIEDPAFARTVLEELKRGVRNGKQFPFRYYSAYQAVKKSSNLHHQPQILDALEECIDISSQAMPHLSGKTICLSDNSGSAWGTFTSEFGTATVAEIDNLSSVITAGNAEEGYVGVFGDRLAVIPVSKRNSVLAQTEAVSQTGRGVGMSTENGIWLFLDKAIRERDHWDNIFIYSDMQAGHGGLYGTEDSCRVYAKGGYATGLMNRYIDAARLVDMYRKTVNPKVNVFSVQTAGYKNIVLPEYGYRSTLLYGWTGKELVFADAMNRLWDALDQRNAPAASPSMQ